MQNFVIKDMDMIKKKVELIESLTDIQIATKILEVLIRLIQDTKETDDIVDQYYKKLDCEISPLSSNVDLYIKLV